MERILATCMYLVVHCKGGIFIVLFHIHLLLLQQQSVRSLRNTIESTPV